MWWSVVPRKHLERAKAEKVWDLWEANDLEWIPQQQEDEESLQEENNIAFPLHTTCEHPFK